MPTPRIRGGRKQRGTRKGTPPPSTSPTWLAVTLLLSQLFPLGALWLGWDAMHAAAGESHWFRTEWVPRLVWVVVLYEFLPFTALSFYLFGRNRLRLEVQRVMAALKLDDEQEEAYFEVRPGRHFAMAVGFASIVTAAGLGLLAFGSEFEEELLPRVALVGDPLFVGPASSGAGDVGGAAPPDASAGQDGAVGQPDPAGTEAGEGADTTVAGATDPAAAEGGDTVAALAPGGSGATLRQAVGDAPAQPAVQAAVHFPRPASGLILGMGFLGAYVWGLLALTRRYFMADLNPGVYYGLSTRMVVAAIVSLVIFNAAGALTGVDHDPISGGITGMIWPAVAFTIGAFPQRGVHWLTERLTLFKEEDSVHMIPLSMIEGITPYDRMRLEEEDVDSCYDLAHADLLPLVLRTPYTPRALKDWILQAKLVEMFGAGITDLRQQGIRRLTDLRGLDQDGDEVVRLAKETSVTENALKRAVAMVNDDGIVSRELALLDDVVYELGRYQKHFEPSPGGSERAGGEGEAGDGDEATE